MEVSIPFKRESVSKATLGVVMAFSLMVFVFQFPSNGKAYPKWRHGIEDDYSSQPMFQFPSNGKAYPKQNILNNPVNVKSFNSLQTGKRIQSAFGGSSSAPKNLNVSIPFKRESVSKDREDTPAERRKAVVSIPFKRESVSKVITQTLVGEGETKVSIPFKRESVSKDKGNMREIQHK